MLRIDPSEGITDEGIQPLAHFVDGAEVNAVAVALEANGKDDPYPAIYVRAGGALSEHLLPPHPLLDFEGADYRAQLTAALKPVLGGALAGSAM